MSKTTMQTPTRRLQKNDTPKMQINLVIAAYLIIPLAVILGGSKFLLYQHQVRVNIPSSTYQAVFLSNGQVYFGHLKMLGRTYMQLSDVYYVQQEPIAQNDQQGDTAQADELQNDDAQNQTQFTVVRLGNELHQPTNEIMLNTEHVLFWESLKPDSQIIDAIHEEAKKQ